MAEAYGKLTGRPGICLVTRGPGATHASVGVHIASQDSTPMILLVGQVPRASRGRDAFQELDYPHAFGGLGLAKWAAEADARRTAAGARLARLLGRGRAAGPGPVVLALPEDVLFEETETADGGPAHVARPAPSDEDLARLGELLAAAERPLVIVGEGGWTAETAEGVQAFCEANAIPVCSSFRCQDYVDNRSPVVRRSPHARDGREAGTAGRGRRPDPRLRRPARRGDDEGLHAARTAAPEADARPRASRPGRARPRLRARAPHRHRAAGAGGGPRAARRAGSVALAGLDQSGRGPTTRQASRAASCPDSSISAR